MNEQYTDRLLAILLAYAREQSFSTRKFGEWDTYFVIKETPQSGIALLRYPQSGNSTIFSVGIKIIIFQTVANNMRQSIIMMHAIQEFFEAIQRVIPSITWEEGRSGRSDFSFDYDVSEYFGKKDIEYKISHCADIFLREMSEQTFRKILTSGKEILENCIVRLQPETDAETVKKLEERTLQKIRERFDSLIGTSQFYKIECSS
ncbi:MAG: hypothetical protein WCE98_06930 [Chlorobium sp.]